MFENYENHSIKAIGLKRLRFFIKSIIKVMEEL